MEKTTLGDTGIEVTRFCFGTWQAAGWATSNPDRFLRTLELALSEGVNFIDTAESYGAGHAEQLVGRAIKGKRDSIILATKFSHTNSTPARLRKSLTSSLRRLGTDYIDLYQQHWPPRNPPLDETLLELEKLKKEGKIRAIGVSNWMEPEFEEAANLELIDSVQPCYSLLWRSIEDKILPLCQKQNFALLPYSPLCQGLLARRMPETPDDNRKKNFLFSAPLEKVYRLLEDLSVKYDKSMSQISLRWLLDIKTVTAPIVGASSPEQLKQNLGAMGWSLEKDDWQTLSEVTGSLSKNLLPHDTLWGWHPREKGRST